MNNICVGLFYFFGYIMFWNKCFQNYPFLKLDLCTFQIITYCKIMSPYMERKFDNITYMFCILNDTLSTSWQKPMIKLSNVYPCALKSMRQKVGAIGS